MYKIDDVCIGDSSSYSSGIGDRGMDVLPDIANANDLNWVIEQSRLNEEEDNVKSFEWKNDCDSSNENRHNGYPMLISLIRKDISKAKCLNEDFMETLHKDLFECDNYYAFSLASEILSLAPVLPKSMQHDKWIKTIERSDPTSRPHMLISFYIEKGYLPLDRCLYHFDSLLDCLSSDYEVIVASSLRAIRTIIEFTDSDVSSTLGNEEIQIIVACCVPRPDPVLLALFELLTALLSHEANLFDRYIQSGLLHQIKSIISTVSERVFYVIIHLLEDMLKFHHSSFMDQITMLDFAFLLSSKPYTCKYRVISLMSMLIDRSTSVYLTHLLTDDFFEACHALLETDDQKICDLIMNTLSQALKQTEKKELIEKIERTTNVSLF